jgi:hypothetical protein
VIAPQFHSIECPHWYLFAKVHSLVGLDGLVPFAFGFESGPDDLVECLLVSLEPVISTTTLRKFEVGTQYVRLREARNGAHFVAQLRFNQGEKPLDGRVLSPSASKGGNLRIVG